MDWTPQEESRIAQIRATESQLAPGASDRRVACSRPEALRRLQRRTREGIYREPRFAMAVCLLPPTRGTNKLPSKSRRS
jgi:hypothetical protein